MVLLHGRLRVGIYEGRELWSADRSLRERCMQSCLSSLVIDPYVTVRLGLKRIVKTATIQNTDTPEWDLDESYDLANDVTKLVVHVKANSSAMCIRLSPHKSLGYIKLDAEELVAGKELSGWVSLQGRTRLSREKNRGQLRLLIKFTPLEDLQVNDPHVMPCYWPVRHGCRVTLYQDAHTPRGSLEPSAFESQGLAVPETVSAWTDMYEAIRDAKHVIYIMGWSVWVDVVMVRNGDDAAAMPLGKLLLQKADEGVRVNLLVWDEVLSTDLPFFRSTGLMDTKDEQLRDFFKNTKVNTAIVPRVADDTAKSSIAGASVSGLFTHHSKAVVVDTDADGSKRRLVAFVGGLDLTYGRYDTPSHSLFETLRTTHSKDFHNACFNVSKEKGPREPWHDIHCRVDGGIARDVAEYMEERWRGQASKKLQDALVDLDDAAVYVPGSSSTKDKNTWSAQMFRSCDERSAHMDVERGGLVTKKGRLIDKSIQRAYVHHIRRAQRYVYIENQYFLGSSHEWVHDRHKDAQHLVPLELVLKIEDKIRRKERFAVYVTIPLWSEGPAADKATQEVIFWQYRTVEMMYSRVHAALKEAGSTAKVTDYLNFFCLGNREAVPPGGDPNVVERDGVAPTPDELLLAKTRRHQIYVHAKMMIVDDEVIVLGSANINERSMNGARDTEAAVGAYQPHHMLKRTEDGELGGKTAEVYPDGDVAAFRKSLWVEHTSVMPDVFRDPASLACVHRMRELGEEGWQQFVGDEVVTMKHHLMLYPYVVDEDGEVEPRVKCFPDTQGTIKGDDSILLPNLLTA